MSYMKDKSWNSIAKNMLRAELKRHGIGYRDLAIRLQAIGVDESESTIASKISRGAFSFAFTLQCLRALGLKELRID